MDIHKGRETIQIGDTKYYVPAGFYIGFDSKSKARIFDQLDKPWNLIKEGDAMAIRDNSGHKIYLFPVVC